MNKVLRSQRLGALLAMVLGAQACVDLGPYSQIHASCPAGVATAQLWEEASDGELRPLDPVACDVVEGATAQYGTQWQTACSYARTTLCTASVADADATTPDAELEVGTPDATPGDGPNEVLQDVTTDAPAADVAQLDAVPTNDGEIATTADADVVSGADGDATEDTETAAEVDAGPQNSSPVLSAPDPALGAVAISGAHPAFEGVVLAGGALSLNFVASDDDVGDVVTVSVEVTGGSLSPQDAGFTGMTWPATDTDSVLIAAATGSTAGTIEFTVTAYDGKGGTDQYTLLLTLNVPPIVPLPVFAPGQVVKGSYPNFVVNMERGDSFSFSYTATDEDFNDELTISANVTGGTIAGNSGISESLPVVSMSTSPVMGSLSGTPTANGTFQVTVVVSDSYGEGESFTVLFIVGGPGFDFNGDGYDDLIVGRCALDQLADNGVATVLLGQQTLPADVDAAVADVQITSFVQGDKFGSSIINAGDINGDGFDDLAVAAPQTDGGGKTMAGAVYLFLGRSNPATITNGSGAEQIILGDADNLHLGGAMAAGDVNGDGFSDLVIGQWTASPDMPASRSVFVFLGSAQLEQSRTTEDADWTISGGEQFGIQLAVSDTTGDGLADVHVAESVFTGSDSVRVFQGKPALPGPVQSSSADATFVGDGGTSNLFARVSTGDFDGDGVDDLLLGGSLAAPEARFVVKGGGSLSALADALVIAAPSPSEVMGGAFAMVGDLNGDGAWEAAVDGADAGAKTVFLVPGSTSDIELTATSVVDVSLGSSSVHSIGGVGDMDGDGFDDVAILYGDVASATNLTVYPGSTWPSGAAVAGLVTNITDALSATTFLCGVGGL